MKKQNQQLKYGLDMDYRLEITSPEVLKAEWEIWRTLHGDTTKFK